MQHRPAKARPPRECSLAYGFEQHLAVDSRAGVLQIYHASIQVGPELGEGPVSLDVYLAPRNSPREAGSVRFGVFRPQGYPGAEIPWTDADIRSTLTKVWSAGRPHPELAAAFPGLRAEFLVFSRVAVRPQLAGLRVGLRVMEDIINRFLAVDGVALLHPYPLHFIGHEHDPESPVSPEQIRAGCQGLQRHYARMGFASIPGRAGLMARQRPAAPLAQFPVLRVPESVLLRLPAWTGRDDTV